mmetsp:Transcript_121264/g.388449  ORF Transcript_121264/g.388449 Transcript_121264/m.388449 type:complete len:110 (-) Transcript_121264:118-447(-)
MVPGRFHVTKLRPTRFDGNDVHCTEEFKSERYAAIFFCQRRGNERVPALARTFIENLGMSMPPEAEGPVPTCVERMLEPVIRAGGRIKVEPGRGPAPRPCSRGRLLGPR